MEAAPAAVTLARMSEEVGPRFSLLAGEGDGALLGLAAGDTAGGEHEGGYAACTQQAVIVAYHLLRHGELDRDLLAMELLELDGDDRDPSVLRAPSAGLRRWLDSLRAGAVEHVSEPGLDPAVRVAPVGMWFRRRPDDLVSAALETARVTHLDASAAVLAAAAAGAVAAGCFAQNGRDMLMAVVDVAGEAADRIEHDALRYAHTEGVGDVLDRLRRAVDLVGSSPEELVGELGSDPIGLGVAGLAIAAPMVEEPHHSLEVAVQWGGSPLGALVGGVVGARVGVRYWPWTFPNDTWFVALGQRLVAGEPGLVNLPVPYAVEQRITYAGYDEPI